MQAETTLRVPSPSGEILFVVEEAPEGGLTAHAASEAIFTEADTFEELESAIRDAVRCHFGDEARPDFVRFIHVRHGSFPT